MIETKSYIKLLIAQVARIAGFDLNMCVLIPDDKVPIKVLSKPSYIGNSLTVTSRFPAFLHLLWPKNFEQNTMPIKDLTLTLNQLNKNIFVRELEKFIKVFERDDIYYLKDGQLNMYNNTQATHTCKLGDNYVKLSPSIVTDMNNNVYEGAVLYLNKEAISGELTYTELLGLYDVLKQADLFLYSQVMLNGIKKGEDIAVLNFQAEAKKSIDIWSK